MNRKTGTEQGNRRREPKKEPKTELDSKKSRRRAEEGTEEEPEKESQKPGTSEKSNGNNKENIPKVHRGRVEPHGFRTILLTDSWADHRTDSEDSWNGLPWIHRGNAVRIIAIGRSLHRTCDSYGP